jgi:hypothetical protein
VAVTYVIDAASKIVWLTAMGPTSRRDIADVQERLRNDPAFRPAYHQLFDFLAATPTDIFGEDVEKQLKSAPFGADVRRAFVVSEGAGYGMARIAKAVADLRNINLRLFDDLATAKRWLLTGE